MQINATYDTATWVRAYLTIWQGMLSFSERELDVLCLIATRALELSTKVLDAELAAEMLLSTTARGRMRSQLGMSTNHFQNTLTSLLTKGALLHTAGGFIQLDPKLFPQTSLTFSFHVHD